MQQQQFKAANATTPAPPVSGLGANIANIALTPQAQASGFTQVGSDIMFNGIEVAETSGGKLFASNNVVQVPIYGQVSGSNQELGIITYSPSVTNGQLALVYAGFKAGNVIVSGNLSGVGYSVPADVSYNSATGQATVTPQTSYYANGSPSILPNAPLFLAPYTYGGQSAQAFLNFSTGLTSITTSGNVTSTSGSTSTTKSLTTTQVFSPSYSKPLSTTTSSQVLSITSPVTLFGQTFETTLTAKGLIGLPSTISSTSNGVTGTYGVNFNSVTGEISLTPKDYAFSGGGTVNFITANSLASAQLLSSQGFTGNQIGNIFASGQTEVEVLNLKTGSIIVESQAAYFSPGYEVVPKGNPVNSYLNIGIKEAGVSGTYTKSTILPGQLIAGQTNAGTAVIETLLQPAPGSGLGIEIARSIFPPLYFNAYVEGSKSYANALSNLQNAAVSEYQTAFQPVVNFLGTQNVAEQIPGAIGYAIGEFVVATPLAAANPTTYTVAFNGAAQTAFIGSLFAEARGGILTKAQAVVQVGALGVGAVEAGYSAVDVGLGSASTTSRFQPYLEITGEIEKGVPVDVEIIGNQVKIGAISKTPLLTSGTLSGKLTIPITRGIVNSFFTNQVGIEPRESIVIQLSAENKNYLINQNTVTIDLENPKVSASIVSKSNLFHTEVKSVQGVVAPGAGAAKILFGQGIVEEAAQGTGELTTGLLFQKKLGAGLIIKPIDFRTEGNLIQVTQFSETSSYLESVRQTLQPARLENNLKTNPQFVVEEGQNTGIAEGLEKVTTGKTNPELQVLKFASFEGSKETSYTLELPKNERGLPYEVSETELVKPEDLIQKPKTRITIGKPSSALKGDIGDELNSAEAEGRLSSEEFTYNGRKSYLSSGFSESNPLGIRVNIRSFVQEAVPKENVVKEANVGYEAYSTSPDKTLRLSPPSLKEGIADKQFTAQAQKDTASASKEYSSGFKGSKAGRTTIQIEETEPQLSLAERQLAHQGATSFLFKAGADILNSQKRSSSFNSIFITTPKTTQVPKTISNQLQTSKQISSTLFKQPQISKNLQNTLQKGKQNNISKQTSSQVSEQISKQTQEQVQKQVQEQVQEQVQTPVRSEILFRPTSPRESLFGIPGVGRRKQKKQTKNKRFPRSFTGVDYTIDLASYSLGLKGTQPKATYRAFGLYRPYPKGTKPAKNRRYKIL